MNRLRWEQSLSISSMYKYLHFSWIGSLSPSKRLRLKGNLIKSTLGRRHGESESREAQWWVKQRKSGLPREKMDALLLWVAIWWFSKTKMLFFTLVRVSGCTPLVIIWRRLSRSIWHQTLHLLQFHRVTYGFLLRKSHWRWKCISFDVLAKHRNLLLSDFHQCKTWTVLWGPGNVYVCAVCLCAWHWVVHALDLLVATSGIFHNILLFRPIFCNFYYFWQALMGADTLFQEPKYSNFLFKDLQLKVHLCNCFFQVLKLNGPMGRRYSSVTSLPEVKLSLELSKKVALALTDI